MQYTKEETKKITKVFKDVLKDIETIWNATDKEPIAISIQLNDLEQISSINPVYYKKTLHLDQNEISIWFNLANLGHGYTIGRFSRLKRLSPVKESIDLIACFVSEYPTIRENLIKRIKERQEQQIKKSILSQEKKDELMSKIKATEQKISDSADIEIDFPKSQNQHKIEVQEESGHKVGTIDFGGRTIRIITTGDIVLVNKGKDKQKKL